MEHHLVRSLLTTALILSLAPLQARAEGNSRTPLPATACPALFGDPAHRAAAAAARQRQLDFVEEDDDGVTVAHSAEVWDEPSPTNLDGLRLVAVRLGAAELEVNPRLAAAMGCAAGRYEVTTDDAISRGVRVLAVLRQALLLDVRGELRYLLLPGAEHPEWLVAWRIEGELGPVFDPTAPPPPDQPMY